MGVPRRSGDQSVSKPHDLESYIVTAGGLSGVLTRPVVLRCVNIGCFRDRTRTVSRPEAYWRPVIAFKTGGTGQRTRPPEASSIRMGHENKSDLLRFGQIYSQPESRSNRLRAHPLLGG